MNSNIFNVNTTKAPTPNDTLRMIKEISILMQRVENIENSLKSDDNTVGENSVIIDASDTNKITKEIKKVSSDVQKIQKTHTNDISLLTKTIEEVKEQMNEIASLKADLQNVIEFIQTNKEIIANIGKMSDEVNTLKDIVDSIHMNSETKVNINVEPSVLNEKKSVSDEKDIAKEE